MPYKIVFFGTAEFSVPSLESLIKDERFKVAAVVTKPDAPIGRHQIITPPPVKILAQENAIRVIQLEKIKTDESFEVLKKLQDEIGVDAYVVVSYGKIIPQRILDLPKRGAINVHGSLLPRWRGASCVQSAIAAGDSKTGVTIMLMDSEMDHGDILAQRAIEILANETGGELHDRLAKLGAETLPDIVFDHLENKLSPKPQDHSQATHCKLLTREDGKIDWNKSAVEIERLVRAYNPWPGTWTEWDGKRIKIVNLTVNQSQGIKKEIGRPQIIKDRLFVYCADGSSIEITMLQPEGKRSMAAKEYLAGRH